MFTHFNRRGSKINWNKFVNGSIEIRTIRKEDTEAFLCDCLKHGIYDLYSIVNDCYINILNDEFEVVSVEDSEYYNSSNFIGTFIRANNSFLYAPIASRLYGETRIIQAYDIKLNNVDICDFNEMKKKYKGQLEKLIDISTENILNEMKDKDDSSNLEKNIEMYLQQNQEETNKETSENVDDIILDGRKYYAIDEDEENLTSEKLV